MTLVRKPQGEIERGTLIKLYNLYRASYEHTKRRVPEVTGMYLKTGWSGQFEFYEIAVLKDESGGGGYVQNYLTSDFTMVPLPTEESERIKEYGKEEEES